MLFKMALDFCSRVLVLFLLSFFLVSLFEVDGYTSVFFYHFLKGGNFHDFLLASLEDEVFPKWSLLKVGSKFFSLRVDPL